MSSVLSPSGLSKPDSSDTGATFYAMIAAAIQMLNDHDHNKAAGGSPIVKTQSILSAAWASQGSGQYRQTVTLPGALTFDTIAMQFRTSAGVQVHPTIEKVSSTSYYIYTNDSTLTYTALYT